jgi:hypothetical protein
MKLKRNLQAMIWYNICVSLNFARYFVTGEFFEAVLYLAESWRCVTE